MKTCFMFGHRDCPEDSLPKIERAVELFVTQKGITAFYVGNRGRFDALAATAAKRVRLRYPQLQLFLLLAYHPGERPEELPEGFDGSFYPLSGKVLRPYAIIHANRAMLSTADSVICYVMHVGNTRELLEHAKNRQKKEAFPIENVAENS